MGNLASSQRRADSDSQSSLGVAVMWVLSVEDFLQLERMPSHEELQEQGCLVKHGLLVQRTSSHFCIFVSHQWLGLSHPDPKLEQLPVLQKALSNVAKPGKLISGETLVMSDLASQFLGDTRRLCRSQRAKLRNGYIWMDWFSIPQKTFCLDLLDTIDLPVMQRIPSALTSPKSPTTNQDLFISSIPFYVDASDVFVALVPRLCHTDATVQCNLKTYLMRGWCRLEMWCCILSPAEKPFLVVKGFWNPPEVEFANLKMTADSPPHEGAFTIESDRQVTSYVMQRALQVRLRSLKKQGAWDLYRFTLARYELLLGLPPYARDLPSFMHDFHFKSLDSAKGIRGIGPLECAILSGHSAMIPYLFQAGFEIGRSIRARLNMKTQQDGRSPLGLALELSWRSPDVAQQLLKFRADANKADGFGMLPLGECRTPEAVKMLIEHRADVNKSSAPFHLTPLSLCCIRCASPGVVAALLECQAEVDRDPRKGAVGASQPLAALGVFSCMNQHCLDVAQLLLDAQAQIDSQYPCRGIFRVIEMFCRLRVRCGSSSALLRFFAETSTTPLGVACYCGGDEYANFLLHASADPSVENDRGHTPFQLARGESVFRVIDEFQTISI